MNYVWKIYDIGCDWSNRLKARDDRFRQRHPILHGWFETIIFMGCIAAFGFGFFALEDVLKH